MSWLQKLHQLEEEKAQQPPRLISIQPPVIPAMEPANDPTLHDWEATNRAYQQHVAHCPQCRSAGQGYGARCGAGAELWQAHQSAPMPAKLAKAPPALAPRPAPSNTPPSLTALLQAAMLACDYWGDGAGAREAMRQDCLGIPSDKRQELAAYFQQMYGGKQ
ncbi:MAG: hypothetical protein Q4A28_03225 [Brachymonas sp.]|nr:hypothetical protein [Brachymonas sp.]